MMDALMIVIMNLDLNVCQGLRIRLLFALNDAEMGEK